MNTQELTALLDRLRAEPHESEWLEFKANRYEAQTLGEYLSALANASHAPIWSLALRTVAMRW